MAILKIPTLGTHISQVSLDISIPIPHSDFIDSYSESSYLAGQVLADLPPPIECSFYRFLLWEFIFGQPGLGRSNPSLCLKWQFHRFLLWELIFGRPGLGDLPSANQTVISQIPTLRTHIWQVRSGHIYPNPPQWFHRFLLWELIFGRPGLGRRSILSNGNFTDSYSEGSYLADQVLADLPLPTSNEWFHRFLLWELIFGRSGLDISTPITPQWFHRFLLWELIFGRPGLGRSTPLKWQFHRFLLWELIFGRPGRGISSIPPPNSVHRFLLWELIFGRPGLGRSTPPWVLILQIPTLRVHIWTTRSW